MGAPESFTKYAQATATILSALINASVVALIAMAGFGKFCGTLDIGCPTSNQYIVYLYYPQSDSGLKDNQERITLIKERLSDRGFNVKALPNEELLDPELVTKYKNPGNNKITIGFYVWDADPMTATQSEAVAIQVGDLIEDTFVAGDSIALDSFGHKGLAQAKRILVYLNANKETN